MHGIYVHHVWSRGGPSAAAQYRKGAPTAAPAASELVYRQLMLQQLSNTTGCVDFGSAAASGGASGLPHRVHTPQPIGPGACVLTAAAGLRACAIETAESGLQSCRRLGGGNGGSMVVPVGTGVRRARERPKLATPSTLLTSFDTTHASPVVTPACNGPAQVLQRLVAGRPELVSHILLPVMDRLMAAHKARLGLGPGPELVTVQGQGMPGATTAATTRPRGQGTEGNCSASPGCGQEEDLGQQELDAEEQGLVQQQGQRPGPAAPSSPQPQPLSQPMPLRYDRHHMPVGWLLQGFGEVSPGLGCLWQQQGAACANVLAAAVRGRMG